MLYYSHVNEDSRIERTLLRESPSQSVVAVAGSGERVIALMDDEVCRQVHIVDVNDEALFLVQLKLAALKVLEIDEYLGFCGHEPSTTVMRRRWYSTLVGELEPACRQYWDKNISVVERGVVHAGHFEKFLQKVRPLVNAFLGRNFQSAFKGGQAGSNEFPHVRWKLLRRLFSMRWVYRLMGNDDEAFVSKDASVGHIPFALNEIVNRGEAGSCFMAHLIFKGSLQRMAESELPISLQREVLQKVKDRLNTLAITIRYYHTDILAFAESAAWKLEAPVFYSVSDILSCESTDYLRQLIACTALTGHTLVWRTFLRNRSAGDLDGWPATYGLTVKEHTHQESTRMYQVFSARMMPA